MRARISKGGFLSIEKLGKWYEQWCPGATDYQYVSGWQGGIASPRQCGLWCPHFRVERELIKGLDSQLQDIGLTYRIKLCQGTEYTISEDDMEIEGEK